MRFTLVSTFALLASSLVASLPISLEARETATVERCLKSATLALRRMSQAIISLNPRDQQDGIAKEETDIEARANELINTLNRGGEEMRHAGLVLAVEVPRIIEPVAAVQQATDTTMQNWISAKPIISRLGGREPVLRLLMRGDTATDVFVEGLISRIPPSERGFARMAGQKSKDFIADAIKEYRKP